MAALRGQEGEGAAVALGRLSCFREPVPETGGSSFNGDLPALPEGFDVFDQGAIWPGEVILVSPVKVATEPLNVLPVAVGEQDA